MLTSSQRALVRTHGLVLGRALLGLLFLLAGFNKLTGEGGVSAFAENLSGMDLPLPLVLAWLVVLIEIVAGAMLILGYRVGVAAAALIGFIVLTILLVHNSLEDPMLLKNLAIAGGLLYVLAYGPGEGWRMSK